VLFVGVPDGYFVPVVRAVVVVAVVVPLVVKGFRVQCLV